MRYRPLGRSGLKVSTVSLGSWLTFGNTLDGASTERIVQRAFELGVNLFDTADVYANGAAELALGKAIAGLQRRHLVLASKCFFPFSEDVNDRGLSRKHIMESAHDSLRRLGTDYLDLFQCHRPDSDTPLLETVRAHDDLIRQGKVLYWGTSQWPAELLTAAVALCDQHGLHRPISNQPVYNLLERSIEVEVVPAAERLGIGLIVFSPLAQGVLTGKYASPVSDDPRQRAGNPKINQFIAKWLTAPTLDKVEQHKRIAKQNGMTPAQQALAYVLRTPGVASAIVGATSVSQLEENVAAADLTLSTDAALTLSRVFPLG